MFRVRFLAEHASQLDCPPLDRHGRYELLGVIGEGATAIVYEGVDKHLGRRVAVKVLRSGEADHRARFLAEAQVTSQLEHPGIVAIHDTGTLADGRPFLVLRRVGGRTLTEVLRAGPISSTQRAVRLARQVLDALAFAHERGVAHRDLKPDNVMVDEHGETIVMDWGLGRARPDEGAPLSVSAAPRTLDRRIMGTPGFLPPEAYDGTGTAVQQDVYAFGVVFWHLLVGQSPWRGTTSAELAFEARRGPGAPAVALDPDLAAVLSRCLAPADQRYADARAVSHDLARVEEGTARKERAAIHVAEAESCLARFGALTRSAEEAATALRELEDRMPRWRPLTERQVVHRARAELERVEIAKARAYGELVGAAERALSHDPESSRGRAVLKSAYWSRLTKAEHEKDGASIALFRQRLVALGGTAEQARLDAPGSLTLSTDPPGAEVISRRVHPSGLVWELGPPRVLGHTPLRAYALARGSYVLTLRAPGKAEVTYPVQIERGALHEVHAPVRLLADGACPPGFVYVPGGYTWVGGDAEVGRAQRRRERIWVDGFLLSRAPVTVGQYGAWLESLPPSEAQRRLPRHDAVEHGKHRPYWTLREGRLPDPLIDNEGDVWSADWPVVGIDWEDARACARFYGGDLPDEVEWARAFRGADGRRYPWGDQFDAGLCWMSWSFRRAPSPQPVDAVRHDISVFGACHGAGLVREWTRDEAFDADDTRAPIRGGGWSSTLRAVRLANRFGLKKNQVLAHVGMRIMRRIEWRQD